MTDHEDGESDVEERLTPGRPGLPKLPKGTMPAGLPRLSKPSGLPAMPKLPGMSDLPEGSKRPLLIAGAVGAVLLVVVVVLLFTGGGAGIGGGGDPEDRVVEYLEAYEDGDCERMVELNPGWLGDGTLKGCRATMEHTQLAGYEMGTVIMKDKDRKAVVRAEITQTVSGDDLTLTATFNLEKKNGDWDFEEPEFG